MKVLLISSDHTILDKGSSGHERAKENAVALGELHVLLDGLVPEERDEGSLRIHVVRKGGLFGASALYGRALTYTATCGIQAIWAQDAFERGILAARIAKKAKLPLYVNVDTDFLSPWYSMTGMFRSSHVRLPKINKKRRAMADRVLPQATGIRVMTERVKSSLVKEYGDRIPVPVVIPMPVHAAVPEKVAFPVTPFPFSLMVAGRLDTARRVIDVLDALARIKDQYPGVGLFVVGDGPERAELEHHARKLRLTDRVVFLGDRRDTWGLMQSAQVFVQASAYEGYGRRLLQAALARVPIITTDVGIVGEVFKGYDDVLAFPPGDPAALAIHIVGLMEDGQARQLLAINADAAARRYIHGAGDIPKRVAAFISGGATEAASTATIPA
ncbi:MAG: glycosyltransferase [Patescibacteria group bacterium]